MNNYNLELVYKIGKNKRYDFVNVNAETREEAIAIHTKSLQTRIEKAKNGNNIWANNSLNYANWEWFELS